MKTETNTWNGRWRAIVPMRQHESQRDSHYDPHTSQAYIHDAHIFFSCIARSNHEDTLTWHYTLSSSFVCTADMSCTGLEWRIWRHGIGCNELGTSDWGWLFLGTRLVWMWVVLFWIMCAIGSFVTHNHNRQGEMPKHNTIEQKMPWFPMARWKLLPSKKSLAAWGIHRHAFEHWDWWILIWLNLVFVWRLASKYHMAPARACGLPFGCFRAISKRRSGHLVERLTLWNLLDENQTM